MKRQVAHLLDGRDAAADDGLAQAAELQELRLQVVLLLRAVLHLLQALLLQHADSVTVTGVTHYSVQFRSFRWQQGWGRFH